MQAIQLAESQREEDEIHPYQIVAEGRENCIMGDLLYKNAPDTVIISYRPNTLRTT